MWGMALALGLITAPPQLAPSLPQQDEAEKVDFRSDPVLRMTIPIQISGSTHHFMVDTGAELTGIAFEIAQSHRLAARNPLTVVAFSGSARVPTFEIPTLNFGKVSKRHTTALAFSRYAIGADGFLGLDVLQGKLVTFDFTRNEMMIQRAPIQIRPDDGLIGLAKVHLERNRLIFTGAAINRLSTKAMLDTGSSISVGNAALKAALLRRGAIGTTYPVQVTTVTGQSVIGEYAMIRNLKIGEVRLNSVPIAFFGTEPFDALGFDRQPALVIGMDVLRLFDKVSIDFDLKQVSFIQTYNPAPQTVRYSPI